MAAPSRPAVEGSWDLLDVDNKTKRAEMIEHRQNNATGQKRRGAESEAIIQRACRNTGFGMTGIN